MSDQAEIEQKLLDIKRAIRERQPDVARQLLIEVLKADPQNAEAWFVSSFLIKDPVAQLEAIQRALSIDPGFSAAQTRMKELQTRLAGPTPLASVYEAEREETGPLQTFAPQAEPPPPPNVFQTDDATLISPRPHPDDAPFEPPLEATRPAQSTDVITPADALTSTIPTPFAEEPTLNARRPNPDTPDIPDMPVAPSETDSDMFVFDDERMPDEPTAATASDLSFLDELRPAPIVEPEPTRIAPSPFFDLLNEPPDSERAVADADRLLENHPFESKSKRGKSKPISLDQPYDPSVKQPKLPPTRAELAQSRGKNAKRAAVKAAKKAQQSRQEQAVTLLLLTLLLAAVLIIAAVVVLRARGGLQDLFGSSSATSAPVIVPSSTSVPPTVAPIIGPTTTAVPTVIPPNAAPLIAPTTSAPGSTTLPPTQTPTPTKSTPSRTPIIPPLSLTPQTPSTQPPTITPQTTGVGSIGPSSGGMEVASASDASVIEEFRASITQAKTLFRETTFSHLSPANAGQIIPLARVALPGLFSVLFHDGRPTLIFQTGGFASRPAATFAIADLLDDQPLMRISMQAASALGAVHLSRDEKTLVSISAARLTVVDPQTARIVRTIDSPNSTNAVSPDGMRAATAINNDAAISLWNLETGKLDRSVTLEGMTPERGPNSLVFSADGTALAVGGCDGSIRVVDTSSGKANTIQTGGGLFDCFDVITFTPDGQYVLAADNNGFGRFRTADSDVLTNRTYPGLNANPRPMVALGGDGQLVAAANSDFLVVWDFATGQELARQRLDGEGNRVDGVTFSADNRFVVTATRGGFTGLTWWGIAGGPLAAPATATIQAQTAHATATAGALMAALGDSGRLAFVRPLDGAPIGLFVFDPMTGGETQLAALGNSAWNGDLFSFTSDGQTVALVTPPDGASGIVVMAADAASTETAPLVPSADHPVLSPNGKYVLFRQSDGTCGLASAADGKFIPFAEKIDCTQTTAVWSPDSAALAVEQVYSSPTARNSAATATRILFLKVSSAGVDAPIMVGPDSPRAIDPAFRPNGALTYLMLDVVTKHYALFTSEAGSSSSTLVAAIPGNTTYHSQVWSPDNQHVALVEATEPEQVLILDAKGNLIARVPGDDLYTQVESLAWSPDSRFIAAGRRTADRSQARIFIYSADGITSVPLTDGLDPRWLP